MFGHIDLKINKRKLIIFTATILFQLLAIVGSFQENSPIFDASGSSPLVLSWRSKRFTPDFSLHPASYSTHCVPFTPLCSLVVYRRKGCISTYSPQGCHCWSQQTITRQKSPAAVTQLTRHPPLMLPWPRCAEDSAGFMASSHLAVQYKKSVAQD